MKWELKATEIWHVDGCGLLLCHIHVLLWEHRFEEHLFQAYWGEKIHFKQNYQHSNAGTFANMTAFFQHMQIIFMLIQPVF